MQAHCRPAPAPLKVVNGLLFNLGWFLVVFTHSDSLAVAVVLAHLALHHTLMGLRRGELTLIGITLAVGVLIDQALFATGILTIDGQPGVPPLHPPVVGPCASRWLQQLPVSDFLTTTCSAAHPAGTARLYSLRSILYPVEAQGRH